MQPHVTAGGAPAATIYALVCPDSGRVRYVGQTIQPPEQRLGQHLRHPTLARLAAWFKMLAEAGTAPVLRVLEVVPAEQRLVRERFWVAEMRRRGEPILNLTRGGQGSAPVASPLVARMCENCGEAFHAFPCDVKRGRRFCSIRCMALFRYRDRARKCARCGKVFRIGKTDCKRYCSWDCYTRRRAERKASRLAAALEVKRSAPKVPDPRLGRDLVGPERRARGERIGCGKLTADAVRAIRQERLAGATQAELALRYHVAQTSISAIVRRRTWAHVE